MINFRVTQLMFQLKLKVKSLSDQIQHVLVVADRFGCSFKAEEAC